VNELRLVRVEKGENVPTIGVLCVAGRLFCVTLELPWRGNARNTSCIPAGLYAIDAADSAIHGRVIRVRGVHGRSDIEIHRGNVAKDSRGCILVGMYSGYTGSDRTVYQSRIAMDSLLEAVERYKLTHLRVCDAPVALFGSEEEIDQ